MSGAVRSEVCEGADTFLPVLIVGTIAGPPQVQCRPQSCLWYWRYHPPALRGLKVLPTAGQTSNYSTYTTNSIYILYTPFTRHFSQTTITVNRQRAISELGATSLAGRWLLRGRCSNLLNAYVPFLAETYPPI
jgi:hypothetical protein